ncbi:MAG TPA: hypothetical protein VI341_00095 [Actinomycetota bacterium]
MFARYFVEVAIDPGGVEAALLDDPQSWLPGLATAANERGDGLLAAVGFGEKIRVRRVVRITLGEPIRASTKTVVPLEWTASGGAGIFPEMHADLEIAPLTPGRCQLAMSARYAPPLGVMGRALDRAVLFRVAEATIKDFLDRLADRLVDAPLGTRVSPD